MRLLYRFLSSAVHTLIYPYGRLRALGGSNLWQGRLGLIDPPGPVDIWIHAASVGEAKVATYLIDYLLGRNNRLNIYLSTMTAAGHKVASGCENNNVSAGFFPLDAAPALAKTFARLNPRIIVIAETEIWPNLIETAAARKVPLILMNGRMSDKSFGRYKYARGLLKGLLAEYEKLFLKTISDKAKYQAFEVEDSRLEVTGDMKFDAPVAERSEGRIKEIRHRLGAADSDFVMVAGSTRPGEEAMLLELFERHKKPDGSFRLIIAPRHLQRLEEIQNSFRQSGVDISLYDANTGCCPLVLVDKMGILNDLYLAADIAFVGGTLVKIGGHNLLEPVWAGTPVLFGPYIDNVIEAKDYILKNNYGRMVNSVEDLERTVSRIISGEISFATKNENDLSDSPTARVGEYILSRLESA